jgi:chemotaxis protein histidine kinase CheA
VSFGKYLKTAFFNQWNLLAFVGSAAFAALGAYPDVFLPLILAGELTYLGLLTAHPKFQRYVDAQAAKADRVEATRSHQEALAHILRTLPRELVARFESLRAQCRELRQIALELKSPGAQTSDLPLEEFQVAGLDRLLWIYLRLLYTRFSLTRFLQKTSEQEIQKTIERLEGQLRAAPPASSPKGGRIRKALEDNLQTNQTRLANVAKARDNYQLVELEIDRLENKIRSLSEMAVNRQEPEYISSQVDQVASSMVETERTMNELQFATGLEPVDDEAPELLRGRTAQFSE